MPSVRLPNRGDEVIADARAQAGFQNPREIIIEIPISQISGSANELNASLIAISAGFLIGLPSAPNSGTVTCVTATSITAIIDNAPIGIALPIIAAITPTNTRQQMPSLRRYAVRNGDDEPNPTMLSPSANRSGDGFETDFVHNLHSFLNRQHMESKQRYYTPTGIICK